MSSSSTSWSSWLWPSASTDGNLSTPAIPWLAPQPRLISSPTVAPAAAAATAPAFSTPPAPPVPAQSAASTSLSSAPSAIVANSTEPPTSPYNKYILGTASLAAFSTLLYTIQMRTRGKMAVPLQELMDSPAGRAANPKIAAYMFAGRAFGTATVLVLTGTLGASMVIASFMGVNSMKEFSIRMQEMTAARFPGLKRSDVAQDAAFDPDTYAFLKEVSEDAAREEREGQWEESPAHAIIGQRVRHEIGPFSRHGQN